MPSASVLVWDEKGRLLLVRNKDTGLWQTIGGAIEPDESPQEAAKRETLEETGTKVSLTKLRTVVGGPEFRITYPNGDVVSYVSVIFDAKILSGDIEPDNEETSEVKWWPVDKLADMDTDNFTRALLREAEVLG